MITAPSRPRPLLAQLIPPAAAILQWTLWPLVRPLEWLFFYPAVFLSSWLGGLTGGLVAALSSTLIVLFAFTPPEFSFAVADPRNYISAGVFLCMGIFFSLLHERLRKSTQKTEIALAEAESSRANVELLVTERTEELQKVNELLVESEERVQLLIAGVKDYAIFMLDPHGRVASWNEGAERIKGYSAKEIVGRHFSCFYSAQDRGDGKPDRELLEALATGQYQDEGIRVRKDGSTFWASFTITPVHDKNNNFRGFANVTRDNTYRKQLEQELVDSEERLRLLIAGVRDYAIFMLDPEGRVASWNEGAAKIKGYSAKEIVGRHFSCFYSMEEQKAGKPERELQQAVANGRYEEEDPRVRKDGTTFWANVVITPVYNKSGRLRGFSKVTRDTTHRKKIEQELRTLAAVAQNSKDFIGICTPDMKGVFLNEAGLRMVGLDSLDDVRNTAVMDYFWPEDRPLIEKEAVPKLLRDGAWRGEVRFRNFKTGEPIHTVWDAFAIRDELGQVTGYATISPNLERMKQLQTALTEADRMLRDSQARHAGIVSSAMDAIITVNEEQKIVVFNAAAEKMFFCPAAQALGQSISKFIPTRFHSAHAQHVREFGETGDTNRAMGSLKSLLALRSDGQEFPIEASISQMKPNGKKLFTVIVRDVTERVRAEEALRRSDATRNIALESAQLGEWQIDLATGTAQRSMSHDRIFGYSEKLREWNFEIFMKHVHPEDRTRIEKSYNECLTRGEKWDFECRIIRPDQEVRWIWGHGSHYKDSAGKPTLVMGTVADITDRKRLEQAHLRAQKLEGLGTLAGGIAHDFNNLLLAINGNAKLASGDLPPDHPVQQSLAAIGKAGRRATDLVRRILAFSRPQESKREVIQLTPVVNEALELLRATLPAKIDLRTDFAPGLPGVSADASQIHQVIINLATNASHAIGPKNGLIEFRLDTITAKELQAVTLRLPVGTCVRLRVRDNGCGMDRATVDRIFDPFFTTKGPGEGTGLGLSVVHGIITSHGAAIRVYSEPGKGTEFQLFFPAAGAAVTVAPESAPPAQRERTEHVLYVDDEEDLVELVGRTLQRLGYRVTGHASAARALEEFRSKPQEFDAVVTDLSMPKMSGFELARELQIARPDIPIVMTSGFVRPEDQEMALKMGLRDFILKPDTVERLGRALDKIFQRERSPKVLSP